MVSVTRSKRRVKNSLGRGVGSIVWVRRRNGSWWPGKIMALDELSGVHIVTPRSGTPVKLLGREDASVDWYNLEKSKRVKAFRCGDFDESIERAESYLGTHAKKRDKYVRREDAILHALELEKELLEKEHRQLITSNFKNVAHSDPVKKKLAVSIGSSRYGKGKLGNSGPDQFSVESGSFLNDETVSFFSVPKEKEGNQPALSKRKFSYDSNRFHIPVTDGHNNVSSFKAVRMCGTTNAKCKNLIDIRKRPNERVTEDIHVKRRYRPQPVLQVLQGAANLPASHLLQSDSCTRSLSEPVVDQTGNIYRAKRSRCVDIPSESIDCLGDQESVPNRTGTFVAENDCGLFKSLMEGNPSKSVDDEQSESRETDENHEIDTDSDEVAHSFSGSSDTDSEPLEDLEGQGKHENVENEKLDDFTILGDLRNLRSRHHAPGNSGVSEWQMRRKRNIRYLTKKTCIESDVKSSNYGTYMEKNGCGFRNGLNELGIIENDIRARMKSFDLQRYALTSKADTSYLRNRIGQDLLDGEEFDLGDGMRTILIDVELKVQATYKKSVPIVSLMSKIDGKAIIGHPIQIEALKEGSSEIFFATQNGFDNEARDNERGTTLPPVWRTARRTASSRVPRLPLPKKPNACGSRKLLKKVKKVSLSSIGLKQKFKHTPLACIPLKLVFSRLYEAIGRSQH